MAGIPGEPELKLHEHHGNQRLNGRRRCLIASRTVSSSGPRRQRIRVTAHRGSSSAQVGLGSVLRMVWADAVHSDVVRLAVQLNRLGKKRFPIGETIAYRLRPIASQLGHGTTRSASAPYETDCHVDAFRPATDGRSCKASSRPAIAIPESLYPEAAVLKSTRDPASGDLGRNPKGHTNSGIAVR